MIVNFELQEKQSICWTSAATEILYGGSAGGGKSHAMRIIAIMLAFSVSNIQIYLFRRVFADLLKNHVEGSSGFRALLSPWIKEKVVKITEEEISFQNGSKIYLCHCQHEKDVYKYQGAEMQVILIDELTHFSEKIYKFLRGRARLGGVEVPQHLKHKLPLILCGSNPGGIGHEFVKQMFIDNCKPLELRKMSVEDGGMMRQYIPARLSDNEVLMRNDWGYSRPFCVLWGAVSDGSLVDCGGIKRSFPRGAIIIYREFYGCTGKANEGLKMNVAEIAKIIKELQGSEKMNEMRADPAIFDVSSGQSIANQFEAHNIGWLPADNKRVAGWQQIRARLRENGEYIWKFNENTYKDEEVYEVREKPMLYFFNTCKNLLRTLPLMQYDKTKPEDLDTNLEDHAMDTLRYLCMTRPIIANVYKAPEDPAKNWQRNLETKNIIDKIMSDNKKLLQNKK